MTTSVKEDSRIVQVFKLLKEIFEPADNPTEIVLKKVDTDERRITAVVLEPTSVDNPDLHNDVYTAEEVHKACENFNKFCMVPNIQHLVNVGSEDCVIEKSFILPVKATIGGQEVAEGSWIQTWKINSDDLWEAVKDGLFTGFSIGAGANIEDIE
jgi:hypothetical protein